PGRPEQHLGRLHPAATHEDRSAWHYEARAYGSRNRLRATRGGRSLRIRSIGFRLAAWYCLVFACGVAAFSIAAWFAMRASLYHAIDEELQDRVRGVQSFMDRQIAALSIPQIRDEFREHSVLGPGGGLLQVCDESGE